MKQFRLENDNGFIDVIVTENKAIVTQHTVECFSTWVLPIVDGTGRKQVHDTGDNSGAMISVTDNGVVLKANKIILQ